jgi:hypothetical protein
LTSGEPEQCAHPQNPKSKIPDLSIGDSQLE